MVKTLRITSVVVVLLAMAIFAFLFFYGVKGIKSDEHIEKFLNAPGIVEAFRATAGNRVQTPAANQVHPLVQQSQAFALIIDPPKPPAPKETRITSSGRTVVEPPVFVSPKFTLIITSYYEQNPELSLALINEPGKGTTWVRQSQTVNHLLIEQIKDGSIIVRSGDETPYELKVEEKKFTPASVPAKPGRINPTAKSSSPPVRPERITQPVSPKTTSAPKTEDNAERVQKITDLYQKLMLIRSSISADPNNPQAAEEKAMLMQKVITDFKNANMNISDEEAQKIADMGKLFENLESPGSEN